MSELIAVTTAAHMVRRTEVFENDTTIFFTYEVDEEYRPIVHSMARAMYQHDNTRKHEFPTGNPEVDDPYLCRADDALRDALPLIRAKLAGDLLRSFESEEDS